jgi:flagellar motor protein MotB
MARCKCPSFGPNQAYLISFGDCMTALLAFFIVLNSMADDQTGANLYSGTGSFNAALNTHGLPGAFSDNRSSKLVQQNAVAPMYMVGDPEQEDFGNGVGPDDTDDGGRIINREEEQFSRFLSEIQRVSTLKKEPEIVAEFSLDVFGALPTDGSLMSPELKATLAQVRSAFNSKNYAMEITVWATTPSQSAWSRAAKQASEIRSEAIPYLQVDSVKQQRVSAVGRTWISSKLKRPAVSICLRRLE